MSNRAMPIVLRNLADLDSRSGAPLGRAMREAADEIERLRSTALYLLSMVDHAQKQGFDPEDLAEIEKARAWLGDGR